MLVTACWFCSMAAALLWPPSYVAIGTAATFLAAVAAQPSGIGGESGWLPMGAMMFLPWMLTGQRRRSRAAVKELQAVEAAQLAGLTQAKRERSSLESATQRMEAQIGELIDLYQVMKATGRALHVRDLFQASLGIAPRLLSAQGLRLIVFTPGAVVLRATRLPDGPVEETRALSAMEQSILQRVMVSGQADEAAAADHPAFVEAVSRAAWAPLRRDRQPIGVLVADELPSGQLRMLRIVADQLALQLSRTQLYRQVEALAVTDALTGLFVRSHFMALAREEMARAARHRLSCTVLMVDLDRFKQKNDTFGHLVGDVVLKEVARLLQRHLRGIDLIARFGGEEFILLLVETAPAQAVPIAQRLKQLVEVHPVRAYDELLSQTVSIGIAGYPDQAGTLEEMIERADQALYAAKASGRNRVVLWSDNSR